jgi:hypothetical protein
MKAISNSELARFVNELPPPGEFRPTATYDPDGDCIEFLFQADDYHAERIDDVVTVYYGRTSGELIGSVIKNLSELKRKHPAAFAISVQDGQVRLRHLFVAAAAMVGELEISSAHLLVYRKLIQVAEETNATAQLCESAA